MNTFPQNFTLIDLTHTLTSDIPTWDGSCGFESVIKLDYHQCTSDTKFRVQNISMYAAAGTHMDAPLHCIPGGLDIAQLPLESLVVPCIVIDISDKADERYSLSIADIENFEKKYGKVPAGSCVIVHTGWSRFWNNKERYRNNLLFPSVSPQAANLLVRRAIVGLGIDTLSPDQEAGYPVHKILLEHKIYIIENVANAQQLPAVGSYIIALPLKGEGLTEAPVRLIGLVKKQA